MPSYRTGTIYEEITFKNKIEDRVILDMIEKMIDNGYVVRIARTGMRFDDMWMFGDSHVIERLKTMFH